jgi:hypothetical protein
MGGRHHYQPIGEKRQTAIDGQQKSMQDEHVSALLLSQATRPEPKPGSALGSIVSRTPDFRAPTNILA